MDSSKIDFKTYNFVEKLFISKSFRKKMKIIRRENGIPNKGFGVSMFDNLVIKERQPRIPSNIKKEVFLADVKNLLKKYNLSSSWLDFFTDYILFNYFGDYLDIRQIITLDLGTKTGSSDLSKNIIKMAQCFDLNPIAILLPPSISQRDLEDYIKVNFIKIKKIQNTYANKLWKINKLKQLKSKNDVRDRYIYKHRHMPKKKLTSEIADKYGQILDYTYINKIIKKQRRRKSAGI